jgi:hypothetical protein
MRFGSDPQVTIPASGFAAIKGLTEDRPQSLAPLDQNLLASWAATTEVLNLDDSPWPECGDISDQGDPCLFAFLV